MTPAQRFEVYFRRPDECVVFATEPDPREISLVHHYPDGHWHCALCNDIRCRHVEAAEAAVTQEGAPA